MVDEGERVIDLAVACDRAHLEAEAPAASDIRDDNVARFARVAGKGWTILGFACVLGISAAEVALGGSPTTVAALLLLNLAVLIAIVVRRRLGAGDWFHPTVLPLGYVVLSLTAPTVYLVLAGRPLEAIPSDVTVELVVLFALTIVGLSLGLVAGLRLTPGGVDKGVAPPDYLRVRALGRLCLLVSVVVRAYTVATKLGQPYGTGSVGFGLAQTADKLALFLLFGGAVLVIVANTQLVGRIVTRTDIVLFAAFALPTLVSGGRNDLLAPLIFAVWAHHTRVRAIRGRTLLAGLLAVTVLFQAVAGLRAGDGLNEGPRIALERTLTAVGTSTVDASETLRRVPGAMEFEHGSTYVAALLRQLPGPLANSMLGTPDDTGAYVFRRLIGFDNPNAGFDFSLPSEGYLNFGLYGAIVAGGALGLLWGFAYRRQVIGSHGVGALLYGVVLATVPLLRSDALSQIKWLLYPMTMVLVAFVICRPRPDNWWRVPRLWERLRRALRRTNVRMERRPSSSEPAAPAESTLSRALVIGTIGLAGVGLALGYGRREFLDPDSARAALTASTGLSLRPVPSHVTSAVNVQAAYSGGSEGQSLVLVGCPSAGDAADVEPAAGTSSGSVEILRRENLVVIYSRSRGSVDRQSDIVRALDQVAG
ncbi:MAG: oligosaccharide repeat unit polymerase [Actinomycetota bacterium]|nr:oligosaccharide repeat unit polymerase [Actinomycetota bacterium]